MAWIEVHQSLVRHKKTNRAIALLKCNRYKFIGHMVALWCWALDNAPDGKLADLLSAEIADAAGWEPAKADEFVNTLIAVGFIDEENWCLHDWEDYTSRLMDLREFRRDAGRRGGLKSGEVRRSKTTKQNEANDEANAVLVEAKPLKQRSTNQPTNQPTNHTNQPSDAGPWSPSQFDQHLREKPPILGFAQEVWGRPLTPYEAERLLLDLDDYGDECVRHSLEASGDANVRTVRYVEGVCRQHRERGDCYAGKPGAGGNGTSAGPIPLGPGPYPRGHIPAVFVADPYSSPAGDDDAHSATPA